MRYESRLNEPEPKVSERLQPSIQEQFQSGLALHQKGLISQAEAVYKNILSLEPQHADSLHLLGVCMYQAGNSDLAIDLITRAISSNPYSAVYHNNRGIAFKRKQRFEEALLDFDRAIQLELAFAEAHNNRANVLESLMRVPEAVSSYERAIELRPDYAEALSNRGCALYKLRRVDEALASFNRAIEIRADYADAYNNRAHLLRDAKRFDEALVDYEKAIALNPEIDYLLGYRLYTEMRLCQWSKWDSRLKEIELKVKEQKRAVNPWISLTAFDDPVVHLETAVIYNNAKYRAEQSPVFLSQRTKRDRLKIGYFSSDFGDHPVSHLAAGLFEMHDKGRVELYAFSFGPERSGDMRNRIRSAFSKFLQLDGCSDEQVIGLSRELGIDIAVNLNGYTEHERTVVFQKRCAPVQVNYLGYPATMGAEYIDYIIADKLLMPPENIGYFKEKVVYLPHSYQVNDSYRAISDHVFSRGEVGLPEDAFVFCCFNNNWKILPEVFDVWMRVLKSVNGSVLWLSVDNSSAARNLQREAADRGVDPQRLVFVKRMPSLNLHLARQRCADLFLDTLPFNAHTTASDALWAGLPVLTQIGNAFAGRVAASLLNAMNLPELITHSREEYEAKAIELALNPEKIAAIRSRVASNRETSPLFDAKLFAQHIEAAYAEMIRRSDAGLQPAHIEVNKEGIATSLD